jgi:hypothetical protein
VPYCVEITVGGDYIAYACASSQYTTYAPVELTYSGQSTVNDLPRFLRSDGVISYGTQSPSGGTSTTASSSPLPTSSEPSTTANSGLPETSQTASPTSPTSPTTSQPASQQPSTAIIAGSVVGGVVVISAIAGIVIWCLIRSPKKEKNGLQPAQPVPPAEVKPFGGYYAPAPSELPDQPVFELPSTLPNSPHMSNSTHISNSTYMSNSPYKANSPHMSQNTMLSPVSAYHELHAVGQDRENVR